MPRPLLQRYEQLLDSGDYLPDPHQRRAIEALDRLHRDLVPGGPARWLERLVGRMRHSARGLYLWGGVGRGKTWMMDLFFDCLAPGEGMRLHFHRFMARVHDELAQRASSRDPLDDVTRSWARHCRVLCFDEFHVSDIADAMLLAGLLEGLFSRGVALVATSNTPPGELYRDGLQRRRFLPAIALIEKHCEVLHLEGETDYRLRLLERSEIYHFPLDADADRQLERSFERMAGGTELEPMLRIGHRRLKPRRRGDGIVWFDFGELCGGPRGAADYIELARRFNTVLLSGVPAMGSDRDDEARRFVHLVDELYDRNVKLLVSSEAPLDGIYSGDRLELEFERTRSRMAEMQTHAYLARPHLP